MHDSMLQQFSTGVATQPLVRSLFCGRRLGIRNRARQLTAEQLEGYRLSQPGGLTAPLHYYCALLSNSLYKHQDAQVACMLIWGEDDGLLVEGRSGGRQPYARAAAAVHVIPHCSHWVQQDQPEVVNKLMSDFLSGLGVEQHHTHQQEQDGLQP